MRDYIGDMKKIQDIVNLPMPNKGDNVNSQLGILEGRLIVLQCMIDCNIKFAEKENSKQEKAVKS